MPKIHRGKLIAYAYKSLKWWTFCDTYGQFRETWKDVTCKRCLNLKGKVNPKCLNEKSALKFLNQIQDSVALSVLEQSKNLVSAANVWKLSKQHYELSSI